MRLWLVGGEDIHLRIPLIRKLQQHGFEVTALGSRSHASLEAAAIPFLTYSLERRISPIQDYRTTKQLVSLFREGRPHIVHAFDTKPSFLAMIAAERAQIDARMRTITGMGQVFSSRSPVALALRPMYRHVQRKGGRLAQMTVFQNRDDQAYFVRQRMVVDGKYALIPGSGVDVESIRSSLPSSPKLDELRNQFAPNGEQIVIMISRLDRAKGVHEFLKASRLLTNEGKKICFLLVGPIETLGRRSVSRQDIERFEPVVRYVGSRNDVPALLSISDICVLPTYYREGVPRVLLEAGALGLPVITTDTPGCRDVVQHEVNGLLVPCRDGVALSAAIRRLLDSPEERLRMGSAGLERVRNVFHLNRVTNSYIEIYEQIGARGIR